MRKKLKQQIGETLIESLVALMIAILSMALLSTAVLTAANVNKATREADEEYASELQQAEGLQGIPEEATVKITFGNGSVEQATVSLYGGEGDFISYDYEPEESE